MSVEFFDEWFSEDQSPLKEELIQAESTEFEDLFSEEVWKTTYKDHKDKTINDTIYRVARAAASAEESELVDEWTRKFYHMLSQFRTTAGGRIYSNIGTEWKGTTLMNCFVAPRQKHDIDSLDSILTNLRNQAQTLKAEGGWGENFSYIRPRGAFIHGIGVETPGAVKYMEMFDKTSEIITAGSGRKSKNIKAKGKIRKGAMMGVLDIWHPDVIEFITAKQHAGRLTKFNISVNCTDDFMEKVLRNDEDETWDLRFPDTQYSQYKQEWDGHLGNWEAKGYPVVVYNTVKVSYLWNLIMESTYNRAEPGVLFLDRANHFSPLNYEETIQATNPCGEQTLAPGGVCNLGSINLARFINDDRTGFNLEQIGEAAQHMVRFLDNINDISETPLPEYEFSMKHKRRVGVGILGWGSALFMLRVRFGSQRAHELRDQVMQVIAQNAYMASIDLAEEKGPFSLCEPDLHVENPFLVNLGLPSAYLDKLRKVGIRNSSLLSIQPTGNTSILANVVSGGLEPIFMPEYVRTVIVGSVPKDIEDVTPKWYEGAWHETEMFKFVKEGDEEILKGEFNGTVYKIDKNRGLTKEVLCEDYGVRFLKSREQWDPSEPWAVTTANLDVTDHVEDLKGFARWVDSAMSKTVNVPNEYSQEDFNEIYLSSYRSGYVKGVTTYRAGTMATVLSAKEEKTADASDEEIILDDVKLPQSAPAVMKTMRAENRKWYLTVVYHEDSPDRPFALFVKTNAREKNVLSDQTVDVLLALARDKGIPEHHVRDVVEKLDHDINSSKITRLISFCLRHGVLIRNIVNALDRVEDAYVGSFVYQIRKFLSSYIKDGDTSSEICPECGSQLVYSEGCKMCKSCGNSKC